MTDAEPSGENENYRGVGLSSRLTLDHEISKMRRIVDGLGNGADAIESIWCDSKAESTYDVEIKPGHWSDNLPELIGGAVFAAGGHNGVHISANGGHGCTLDPDWPGDREMIEEMLAQEVSRLNQSAYQPPTILQLKDIMVEHFTKENFIEVGIVTGWSQQILKHNRLLRSLSFGDDDLSGNVLEILAAMDARNDGTIGKVQAYVSTKFPGATKTMIQTGLFTSSKPVLGYTFVAPKKDIIGVMMPFGPSFQKTYDAIERACAKTPLRAKRADQVWNNSTVIHDILELINHSAIVICDLTGRNPNVFYELGIAHAWGKTVVPITQNAADVPFDLSQHRYLTYHNNDQGIATMEVELAKRLVGLLGHGSLF